MSFPSSPVDGAATELAGDKKRSSRACDQCRKTKSKCKKPTDPNRPCTNCFVLGITCTFQGPSYKRGPPKGYISAIEQRLHQVEAIFGALVNSRDERTRSIIGDLRKDPLANEIISRVESGPYGSSSSRSEKTPSTDISDGVRDKSDPRGSRESRLTREIVSSAYDVLPAPTPEWIRTVGDLLDKAGSGMSSQGSPHSEGNLRLEDNDFSVNDVVEKSEDEEAIGKLSVDEKDEIRYHAESSGMPLLDKLTDNPGARNAGGIWRLPMARTWPYARLNLAGVVPDADEIDVPMPSESHQDLLIQLYFTYVHPEMPILHKPTFMRHYQTSKLSGTHERTRPGVTKLLLLSMFTLSSRFNPNEMPLPRSGEMWEAGCDYLASARQLLNAVIHQSSLQTCQALILLSYREFGLGSFEQSYIFMGMALRMAIDLGLNRAADLWQRFGVPLFTPAQKQERKQVWWSIQITDKCISCFLGRPMMITERFYDTDLPQERMPESPYEMLEEEVEIWEPHPGISTALPRLQMLSHTLSSFKASASLSLIFERIVEKLYCVRPKSWEKRHKYLRRFEVELQDWCSALPAHLHYNISTRRPAPPHIIMLHIQHAEAQILLHRRFIPRIKAEDSASKHGIDTEMEFQHCQRAAEKITTLSLLLRDMYSLGGCSPLLASFLLSAGIIHIAALAMDLNVRQAATMLEDTLSCLKDMETIWPSAVRNWELLYSAKVRFHEKVSGAFGPERLPSDGVLPAYGSEPNNDMSMRLMAHLLGLKFPGIEASHLNGEGPTSELFNFHDPESSQIGPSAHPLVPGLALQNETYEPALHHRFSDSIYRDSGPTYAGYDFQSFTNPDGGF